ncbi:Putative transport protein [Enterobacter hormaechei]|nr:Putative transport protein [Enterobacter hormaechei]
MLATIGIALTLWVVPDSKNHVLNRESGMVKGCFSKVIAEPRLLKLNFGIMCLHILLMSTFVALPGQLASAGFPAAEHWKIYLVTMLISFVSVVPFIIYAEVKRKMKTRLRGLRGVTADCRDCAVGRRPAFLGADRWRTTVLPGL